MSDIAKVTPPPAGVRRWRLRPEHRWPVGLLIGAAVLFTYYYLDIYIDGAVSPQLHDFMARWLSLKTINVAMVWVMLAVGLNIVVGYAGLLDLGFVAFWAIGGYTAGWIMSGFFYQVKINFFTSSFVRTQNMPGIHINFWLVLVAAALVCAFFGIIIGAPTLRLRSDYLALVTLGFGEIIPQVFHNGDKQNMHVNISNGAQGINPVDSIRAVGFNGTGQPIIKDLGPFDDLPRFGIFVFLTAVVIFISLRLREGKLGRAWLAIREDELAASAMGVPLMRTKLSAYAMGAVAGGIGGAAYAAQIAAVLPDRFKFDISITLLAMVVLGGMGNVWGVALGAFILQWFNDTGLPRGGDQFNSTFGTNINFPSYSFFIFGSVLVLMMLFRREGFLPEARTRLVLREPGRTEAESLGAELEEVAPDLEALPGEQLHAPAGEGRP
jgi:branched-chain amino acid transport system permease protein